MNDAIKPGSYINKLINKFIPDRKVYTPHFYGNNDTIPHFIFRYEIEDSIIASSFIEDVLHYRQDANFKIIVCTNNKADFSDLLHVNKIIKEHLKTNDEIIQVLDVDELLTEMKIAH